MGGVYKMTEKKYHIVLELLIPKDLPGFNFISICSEKTTQ